MTAVVYGIGFLLIAFIIWWFWLSKPKEVHRVKMGKVDIIVDGGVYKPARIQAAVGEEVTLRFIRKDGTPCAQVVMFPDFNISAELPINEPFEITIRPKQVGEFEFTCEMAMYRGVFIVR